jgi:hypothetical protein
MDILHHPTELLDVKDPLERAVLEALWEYDPIRHFELPIEVKVQDGVVELRGYVRTRTSKTVAGELARSVPGVRQVQNNLISDTELDMAVAMALANDERTREYCPQILVRVMLGTVHLVGHVPSAEVKAAAEEVARSVPGVRGVLNRLEAPPAPPPAGEPVAEPAEEPAPVEAKPTPEAISEAPAPEPEPAAPAVEVIEPAPELAPEPAAPAEAAPEPGTVQLAEEVPEPATGQKPWEGPRPRTGTGKLAPPLSDERRRMLEEWRARQ